MRMTSAFLVILASLAMLPLVSSSSHPSYSGFASPLADFSLSNRNITFATSSSTAALNVATNDSAVYRYAYASYDGGAWTPVTLSGTTLGGAWLNGSSVASVTIRPVNFTLSPTKLTARRNFIVTYSCTRTAQETWDCHDGWQIWQFNASLASGTPQGPVTVTVTASTYETGNPPENAYDSSLATRWSGDGVGAWLQFAFSSPQEMNNVHMAFYNGATRVSYFNVSVSDDGSSWTQVYDGQSSGTTAAFETFPLDTVTASYLRITGGGNSGAYPTWNSYTEVNWSYVYVPEPTCIDGQMNGAETGIDCGGTCPACECTVSETRSCVIENGVGQETRPCVYGHYGTWGTCLPISCNSGYHVSGASCVIDSCTDSIQNQDETGVDCGGSCPEECYTGTQYYVSSSTGNDAWSGLAGAWDGTDGPWRTISHVNVQDFLPGDAVLFRRGDVWRDALYISSPGSPSAYITYSAYGPSGDPKPRILGSTQATGWTQVATNIWSSSASVYNPYGHPGGYDPAEIWFEESDGTYSWGRHQAYSASYTALTREYDWTWYNNIIYVYSTTNPAVAYSAIEVPQREAVIYLQSVNPYPEYIHIDNLEIQYGMQWGITSAYTAAVVDDDDMVTMSGLKITNCHIGSFSTKGGSSAFCIAIWNSDTLIQNNVIHDCGRRGVSYNTYDWFVAGLNIENVVIDHNTFSGGYHTTGPDISTDGYMNHFFNNFTISNNFFDDREITEFSTTPSQTSNSIYIHTEGNHYSNFYIYNNVIVGPTARAILLGGGENYSIYHNTVYASHPNSPSPYSLVMISSVENVDFRNNVIYGTLPRPQFETACIAEEVSIGTTITKYTTKDYNLYYQNDSAQPFYYAEYIYGLPSYHWAYYHMDDWETYKSQIGWDTHSPVPANPMFVNPASSDFHLQGASPARNAGTPISMITIDIEGNIRDPAHPSLGAYEYTG